MPETETATAEQATPALAETGARGRLARRLIGPDVEPVAEGVWLIRGDIRKSMNVYLIADQGGVTVFDAGTRAMRSGIAALAASMGGVKRVVLGHGHPDHRGAAAGLGAPVFCHADEAADAEGDGGAHYFDMTLLQWFAPGAIMFPRPLMPRLIRIWDGGPVKIEGTLAEGDEVAGFEVVHLPGHAPGQIALWRESDRLALSTDVFYTLDPETGRPGHPRLPHRAFNRDTEQARASIRRLAAMEPAAAWPGHARPLRGDVRAQLERAAETT